jgi:hypothetical protein
MKVRLTKKLAECIDGIPLNEHQVGDVLDLPAPQARLLLAEEWAAPHVPGHKKIRPAVRATKRKDPRFSLT